MQKIFPEHEFITNELSQHIQRGKNTTTHTSLLNLGNKTYIADTPGFSYLKIPKIDASDVRHHFPEISSAGEGCKFANCLHMNEPKCAVKDLVESGGIVGSRYRNYTDLVNTMENASKDYKMLGSKYI